MGWSPVGVECGVARPIRRLERWSILPALTNEGYLDWLIYQGSITADLYLQFLVEIILLSCEAFPGRRSVLIIDNASIHKDVGIKTAYQEVGVLLQFLPLCLLEGISRDILPWVQQPLLCI